MLTLLSQYHRLCILCYLSTGAIKSHMSRWDVFPCVMCLAVSSLGLSMPDLRGKGQMNRNPLEPCTSLPLVLANSNCVLPCLFSPLNWMFHEGKFFLSFAINSPERYITPYKRQTLQVPASLADLPKTSCVLPLHTYLWRQLHSPSAHHSLILIAANPSRCWIRA